MTVTLALADFDLPTRSASGFLLRHVVPRVGPLPLYSLLDRRLPFTLSTGWSDIIIGMGHGEADAFTGQNMTMLLEVNRYQPQEVKGKVIYLLSCQTGDELGPDTIRKGAISFLGFTDDYVWVMDSDMASTPWSDEMAASCLMPPIDAINALLDGKTTAEAYNVQTAGYIRNAETEEDELIKSLIEFNMRNAVLLGDRRASVRARPKIVTPLPPPPIIIPLTKPKF